MDLVKQSHWDENYKKAQTIVNISPDNPIIEWMHTHIPRLTKGNSCIEIGVFPGGYINEFGKLG